MQVAVDARVGNDSVVCVPSGIPRRNQNDGPSYRNTEESNRRDVGRSQTGKSM